MANTIGSDRNYNNWLNGGTPTSSADKVYDAVFSNDDSNQSIQVNDFLNLMITQMTNQDFTNPTDDTQYLTQMAQFATMSQMTELAEFSKQNYIMSLLGKTATVSKYSIGGGVTKDTGLITSINLANGDYTVTVNGKSYSLEQIMQLHASEDAAAEKSDKEVAEDNESEG